MEPLVRNEVTKLFGPDPRACVFRQSSTQTAVRWTPRCTRSKHTTSICQERLLVVSHPCSMSPRATRRLLATRCAKSPWLLFAPLTHTLTAFWQSLSAPCCLTIFSQVNFISSFPGNESYEPVNVVQCNAWPLSCLPTIIRSPMSCFSICLGAAS